MRKSSGFTLMGSGFNTDDGIRRAAIHSDQPLLLYARSVSIPMTVLGGLQFQNRSLKGIFDMKFQYR